MEARTETRGEAPTEPAPAAAEAAESAAMRSGAFIAPKPVDPGIARQVPPAQPAVPSSGGDPQVRPKGRVPSLIERVTGVGRARATPPPAAERPAAPPPPPRPTPQAPAQPPRPTQPRLAPLESEQRPGASKEDDLLDIPAFLRRQAN